MRKKNVILILILLIVANTNISTLLASEAIDDPAWSWSRNLKTGEQFEWVVDTYSNTLENETKTTDIPTNPTPDVTYTTTMYTTTTYTSGNYSITNYTTTTYTTIYDETIETPRIDAYEPGFDDGTVIKIKILKPPSEISMDDVEGESQFTEYFEYSADGSDSSRQAYILPISLFIFPVRITYNNGTELNFFEAVINKKIPDFFGEEEEDTNRFLSIEDNIFSIRDEFFEDNVSYNVEANWQIDTGLLNLYHVKLGDNFDLRIIRLTGEESSLQLPISFYWIVYSLIFAAILIKRGKFRKSYLV